MRPRQRILLVDTDEAMLSTRAFTLGNRKLFVVVKAPDAETALALLGQAAPTYDAMACELALEGAVDGNRLSQLAKELRPGLPVLLFSRRHFALTDAQGAMVPCWADAWLPRGLDGTLEICDALRRLTMRKRGPKPAVHAAETRGAA